MCLSAFKPCGPYLSPDAMGKSKGNKPSCSQPSSAVKKKQPKHSILNFIDRPERAHPGLSKMAAEPRTRGAPSPLTQTPCSASPELEPPQPDPAVEETSSPASDKSDEWQIPSSPAAWSPWWEAMQLAVQMT